MENQSVTTATPTADKTPEQIEREMLDTREALTSKVAALENQVVGTVQTAADTISGTVESVKSFMTSAPGAVSDTVKQAAAAVGETMKKTFDISGHVRDNPLAAVGVSVLAGGLTGYLLGSGRQSLGYSDSVGTPPGVPTAYVPPSRTEPPAPSKPSMFDELFSMIGRKLREVAENAIDTASKAVNQSVEQNVPKLVDSAAGAATERLMPGEPRYAGRRG